jgi:FkbM family methyltransferase
MPAMFSGRRPVRSILLAPFRPEHYRAALNSLRVYDRPFTRLRQYVTSSGRYPTTIRLRTPSGTLPVRLHTAHDLRTVNEVFCRVDYPCQGTEQVIVDFGSNIGISALYFLSHAPNSRCYLYEPLPENVRKLRDNLAGLHDRFVLHPVAVGLHNGVADFGYEETGRYGGIGLDSPSTLQVPCRRATDVLDDVLSTHETIDILKIDIESLEKEILASIRPDQLRRIRTIYIEQQFETNPFPSDLFHFRQTRSIAQFTQPQTP